MSTMVGARTSALSPWVWVSLPWLATFAVHAPVFPTMVREWHDFPNLSHGFAIPFIAGYLLWARRDRIVAAPIRPTAWGLPLLVLGLVMLVIGVHGEESFIARLALPVTLLGATLFVAGPSVLAQVWPGIAYLVFMIPLPWSTLKLITYRSRLVDAAASTQLLAWLGVPVFHDGVLLHLPNISLEVADECSSIPAIAALLSLGVAYATLTRRSTAVRIVLIVAALPFAIVANIIRITTTAALAYYVGPWTLGTAYHAFNGTVNFVFTFFLLLALDSALLRWTERRR